MTLFQSQRVRYACATAVALLIVCACRLVMGIWGIWASYLLLTPLCLTVVAGFGAESGLATAVLGMATTEFFFHERGGEAPFVWLALLRMASLLASTSVCGLFAGALKRSRGDAQHVLKAIEQEQNTINAMFDSFPVGIFVSDKKGKLVRTNARGREIWSGNVPVSQSVDDYGAFQGWDTETKLPVAPTDWPLARALNEGITILTQTLEIRRFDGNRAMVLHSAAPIKNSQGEIIGAVVCIIDVTKDKEIEEQFKRKSDEMALLLDIVPVAVWMSNDPECRFIVGNRRGNALAQVSSGENVSATGVPQIRRFFSPDGRALEAEELPMQRACATNSEIRDVELYLQSGNDRKALVGNAVPLRNEDGSVRGCIASFMDVTEWKKAEEKARLGQQRYAAIHDHAPCPIALHRLPEGNVLEVNEAWEKFFECPREEALGKTSNEMGFTVDFDARARLYEELRERGFVRNVELPFRTRTGKIRFGSVSFDRVEIEGQSYQLGVILDVTERKRAEDALREREREYVAIFEQSIVGKAQVDPQTGCFLRANKALADMMGYTVDELCHMTFMDITHPDDLPANERILASIRAGLAETWNVEKRYVRKDGSVIWGQVAGNLLRTEEGRPVRMVAVIQNVTERKKAEQERNIAYAKFHALFDSNVIGIVIVADDLIIEANDYFINMLGYTREEFNEKRINRQDITPAGYESVDNGCIEFLRIKGICPTCEKEYFRRDGTRVPVLLGEIALPGPEGQVIAYVVDVSLQKAAEEALRAASQEMKEAKEAADLANQAKSIFLANMSHEIRTPLSAILGFTDLLKTETLSPQQRKHYVDIVSESGEQLATLINDILDLSKVEAGRLELELSPVKIDEVVGEVLSMLTAKSSQKGISMSLEVLEPMPATIQTDRLRLKQILINLIGNSIKFTGEGGMVTVSLSFLDHCHQLNILVKDSGIGIPHERWDAIFDPFHQGDSSMTRRFGGTGLGLTFSRKLARLLQGDLQLVSSEPGKGSVFLIKIADFSSI